MAQVVSGIGFLGSGTIINRHDQIIDGLTTAAGVRITVAIELTYGSGLYSIRFIDTNFDFIRLLMQEILANKLANQYYAEFFSGNKETLHQIAELQAVSPKINHALPPVQILRSIIGPAITHIFQTKLFQIPADQNDLSIIERQIINHLTKK